MPNISIDQLQIFDSLDGSQIFPHVHPTNNVTYHAHVSAIFYDNAVTENVIQDGAVTTDKIADQAITSEKLAPGAVTFSDLTVDKLIVSDAIASDHIRINQLDYTFPAIREANKFLKHTNSGNLEWATAAEIAGGGSGGINLVSGQVLPVGAITQWGSTDTPAGWLFCHGQGFDGTQYPELSTIVGDTYKVHDGDTYYLPDLRARVPIGVGSTRDVNNLLNSFTIGLTGGEFHHTLIEAEMPRHTHYLATVLPENPTVTNSAGYDTGDSANGLYPKIDGLRVPPLYEAHMKPTTFAGSNASHNNIQPFLATEYIIKAKPDTVVNFAPTLGKGLSAKDADGTVNTSSLNLSSSEIGLLVDGDDFKFDGDKRLQIKKSFLPKYKLLSSGTIGLIQETVNPGDSPGVTFTWNFDDFTGTGVDMTRVAAIYVDVRIELGYLTDQFTTGPGHTGGSEEGSNILVHYQYPGMTGMHLVADDFLDVNVVNAQNEYAYVSRKSLLLPIDYVPGGTFALKVTGNNTSAGRRCHIHVHGVQQFEG